MNIHISNLPVDINFEINRHLKCEICGNFAFRNTRCKVCTFKFCDRFNIQGFDITFYSGHEKLAVLRHIFETTLALVYNAAEVEISVFISDALSSVLSTSYFLRVGNGRFLLIASRDGVDCAQIGGQTRSGLRMSF